MRTESAGNNKFIRRDGKHQSRAGRVRSAGAIFRIFYFIFSLWVYDVVGCVFSFRCFEVGLCLVRLCFVYRGRWCVGEGCVLVFVCANERWMWGFYELLLHMRKLRSFARFSLLIQWLYHGVVNYYFTLRVRGFYEKIFLIFNQSNYNSFRCNKLNLHVF